jgi:hypothetical protein
MAVTQENKTYFVSSRLHLPHGMGGSGTYSYFLPNKLRKYQLGKWKWKNVTYFQFLHIKYGALLVRYRRNG